MTTYQIVKAFQLKLTRHIGEDIELCAVADLKTCVGIVALLYRLWRLDQLQTQTVRSVDIQVASSLRYELAVYGLVDIDPVLDAWEGCDIVAVNVQKNRTYLLTSDDKRKETITEEKQ